MGCGGALDPELIAHLGQAVEHLGNTLAPSHRFAPVLAQAAAVQLQGLLLATQPAIEGFGGPTTAHQRRSQALRQKGITERGGITDHQQAGGGRSAAMQGMVASPDAQAALLAPAGVGREAEAGQQGRQYRLRIRLLLADERPYADAPAPQPWEGPAEAMVHQAKLKVGRVVRRLQVGLHFHGHRGGVAGAGRTDTMGPSQGGARAIGDHHPAGAELPAVPETHPPESFASFQGDDIDPMAQFGTCLDRPIRQELIQYGPAHDPERCIAGQLRHDGIFQAPGEAHPSNHLVDGGCQIKREPALHGGRHATAAGFCSPGALAFQQQHAPAALGQMESG